MGITNDQNLPDHSAVIKEGWTMRKLFPVLSAVNSFAKQSNIFELMTVYMVLVSSFGELFGKNLSCLWYLILSLMVWGSLCSRKKMIGVKTKKNGK